jgi:hypothetical protein
MTRFQNLGTQTNCKTAADREVAATMNALEGALMAMKGVVSYVSNHTIETNLSTIYFCMVLPSEGASAKNIDYLNAFWRRANGSLIKVFEGLGYAWDNDSYAYPFRSPYFIGDKKYLLEDGLESGPDGDDFLYPPMALACGRRSDSEKKGIHFLVCWPFNAEAGRELAYRLENMQKPSIESCCWTKDSIESMGYTFTTTDPSLTKERRLF